MVDVVFLLLIFLLVTTTFRKDEHAFIVDLPTSSTEQVTISSDKTTVFITKDGTYHLLTVPADQPVDGPELDATNKVDAAELRKQLAALHERKPDASIAIRGEKATSYQLMMDVMSVMQEVGFKNIWFPYEHSGGQPPAPE